MYKRQPDVAADAAIADRLWGATFLPVLQELDEEVASPAEIDMGAGLALRFGKAPCTTMDAMGETEVARLIGYYCEKYTIETPKSLAPVGTLLWLSLIPILPSRRSTVCSTRTYTKP